MKKKLAYVVTEKGCMDPTTGAFQHITVGLRELVKHFDVETILPDSQPIKLSRATVSAPSVRGFRSGQLFGALRDIRDFYRLLIESFRLSKKVRTVGCSSVYIRVQALSPLPLLFRCLGIKTFLEANGLQFESRKTRFPSLLSFSYKPFERLVYRTATYVFFVGSYGHFWQIEGDNWSNVENGIEAELLEYDILPKRIIAPFRFCLLARLVGHHQANVLIDAFKQLPLKDCEKLELHMIGSGFENLEQELHSRIKLKNHGHVSHDKIKVLLDQVDVGIITGGPEYASHMKLFDYAASGCLILAPRTYHLETCYSGQGVHFFEPGNSEDLCNCLRHVLSNPQIISESGSKLRQWIKKNYSWESIFAYKAEVIHRFQI